MISAMPRYSVPSMAQAVKGTEAMPAKLLAGTKVTRSMDAGQYHHGVQPLRRPLGVQSDLRSQSGLYRNGGDPLRRSHRKALSGDEGHPVNGHLAGAVEVGGGVQRLGRTAGAVVVVKDALAGGGQVEAEIAQRRVGGLYFNIATPYLSNLSFWATESFRGGVEIPFTGCAVSGETFTAIPPRCR